MKMDASEAEKLIFDKISKLEPEHISKKIMGYIYFQGLSDQEMIRLALGPETLIHSLIQKAKKALLLASSPSPSIISPPISPTLNPSPSSDPSFHFPPFSPQPFSSSPSFRRVVQNPLETMNIIKSGTSNFPKDYYCPESGPFNNVVSIRGGSRNLHHPVKTCHYFNKGFCKHGSSCRYFHGETYFPDNYYPHIYDPTNNSYEDQIYSPRSLEKLELEITELLKSRRGSPVSIASLPMMYYDKYGKTLQAEGYLTESQRHGKAGYSLTKLLARLKNSIRLIDRPHGQHAVILAEDAHKYIEIRGERNDPGPIVNGSRQIYMTFPAESTFTEEDVSNYFSTFGQVQDVRIPCQQKRMFGFVTFMSADTAHLILSKVNPHFVCGARVLVKPYREKSKLVERKYLEKFDHPMYYHSHPSDIDMELQANWESSRLIQRQLMEEHRHALELETMRLSQLHLSTQSCFSHSMDDLKLPQDHSKFPSAERFNYLLDVLNNGSTSDDNHNPKYLVNNCGDHESGQGINLPDSPFASAVASSISAVI